MAGKDKRQSDATAELLQGEQALAPTGASGDDRRAKLASGDDRVPSASGDDR